MTARKKRVILILFRRKSRKKIKRLKRKRKNKRKIKKEKKNKFELIEFLEKNKFKTKTNIHTNRRNTIIIPKNFSFIENPDETIEILTKIFYLYNNKKVNSIYIDYSFTENLDLCASAVMDSIILECDKYRDSINNPVNLSGRYSKSKEEMKNLLEVSGIVNDLGFELTLPENVKKLDLIECGDSDIISTKVTNYFNECLKTQNYELNRNGKKLFSEMIGEVANNCQLHSGNFKKWYTLGHYFFREEYGECQIVIFNFGNSIYESLKSSDTSEETIDSLKHISSQHKRNSFFQKRIWNEETLWTLYSLQDGVSRVRNSISEPDRGTGTIKLIDSFQKIGKTVEGKIPLMSITSGNTSILFNDNYSLKSKIIDNEERQIIAFNSENDLFILPDSRNVKLIKNKFCGTVISMKFYLDKRYIKNLMEG